VVAIRTHHLDLVTDCCSSLAFVLDKQVSGCDNVGVEVQNWNVHGLQLVESERE
jgi:hypothetical protein